jgi:NADH-quinone oxidoreductase subunit C
VDRSLRTRLETRFADRLTGPVRQRHDNTEIRVRPSDVIDVLRTLHDDPDLEFVVLADLCGVDTGDHMQVVYHLWSAKTPDWLRVIADGLPRDNPRIATLTGLWPGAEWMERETYDMFGIIFEGNRDLRRIYMPDDAARSPGGGVRHMERTHAPSQATERVVRRTVKA